MIILTWNRDQGMTWSQDDYDKALEACSRGRSWDSDWSVGRNKNIDEGEECFMLIQGVKHPRGLMAYGVVCSQPWRGKHYADPNRWVNYVDLTWRAMRPVDQPISVEVLRARIPDVGWSSSFRQSGYRIRPPQEAAVREVWADASDA